MSNKSGFTLIEAMFVVLIIGILAAISVSSVNFFGRPAYLTSRQMVSDLRHIRTLAVTSGIRHYMKLLPAGGPYTSYEIYKDTATPVKIGDTRTISNKVTSCTQTGFDSDVFKFSYLGVRYGSTSNGLITVNDGTQSYTVTIIAGTGRIFETKN